MHHLTETRPPHADQNWPRVYELLGPAGTDELGADELTALADATWLLGKLDESVAARERAFEARSRRGDTGGAAMEAFYLSLALGDKGADAPASRWRSRAYSLVEDDSAPSPRGTC